MRAIHRSGCILLCILVTLLPAVVLARGGPGEPAGTLNRLAKERSPYLRQHATNPVDWYPWGKEAFALAKRLDKPIFLSIGYAACHWCHVMEHESFEHEGTARMLNEAFVCVKVDREERPDIDRLYMNAVVLMAGRGGWPLTVVLTPDARPFWGGTYLRRGELQDHVRRLRGQWRAQRRAVLRRAESYAARLRQVAAGPRREISKLDDRQLLAHMRSALARRYDGRQGGYRGSRKFPPHAGLLFFLEEGAAHATAADRRWVRRTLNAMSDGGIHDQVAGGWHRYTVDDVWLVPHFEKMLYDNALLVQAYARQFARTREPRDRRVVERALSWIETRLKRPGGGYASSLDADTRGHEGTTYTWTRPQLRAALSAQDTAFAQRLLDISSGGNVKEAWWQSARGRSVPHLPVPLRTFAARSNIGVAQAVQRRERILAQMLKARDRRPQPALDDKVITSWNGMLLSAFAKAGAALGEPVYLERGRALAGFLLRHSRKPDGSLLRFPAGSGREIRGFCEDYAHLIDGLLDLADATGEPSWREAAADLGRRMLDAFADGRAGGFFATAQRGHGRLLARDKPILDRPIPSDNAVAARVCLRLAVFTGEGRFRNAADRTFALYRDAMAPAGASTQMMGMARALATRFWIDAQPSLGSSRPAFRTRQDVVGVSVFVEHMTVAPLGIVAGARVPITVHVALDLGWHVGSARPGAQDAVPTKLEGRRGSPWRLVSVRYPEAVRRKLGSLPGPVDLYQGAFTIDADLLVPDAARPGRVIVPLELTLQPCNEETCKQTLTVRLDVPVVVRAAR